jgi:catecholate siderophore receptor
MEGLSLGGGAIYQSVTAVNNPTSEAQALNKVPNYWRFDAYASYAFKRVELQLNLNNLSDAFYYEQYYSGHAVPAAGRSATLTGSFRF